MCCLNMYRCMDTYAHTYTYNVHTIQIWDKNTLQVSKVLKGHKNSVRCLCFDSEIIISGSSDTTVKLVPTAGSKWCTYIHHMYTLVYYMYVREHVHIQHWKASRMYCCNLTVSLAIIFLRRTDNHTNYISETEI